MSAPECTVCRQPVCGHILRELREGSEANASYVSGHELAVAAGKEWQRKAEEKEADLDGCISGQEVLRKQLEISNGLQLATGAIVRELQQISKEVIAAASVRSNGMFFWLGELQTALDKPPTQAEKRVKLMEEVCRVGRESPRGRIIEDLEVALAALDDAAGKERDSG